MPEDRSDIDVDPHDRHVEMKDDGRVAEIKSKSGSTTVRCPHGTNVSVGSMSGGGQMSGEFGFGKISAISGSVTVDSATGGVEDRAVNGSHTVGAFGGYICSYNKCADIKGGPT